MPQRDVAPQNNFLTLYQLSHIKWNEQEKILFLGERDFSSAICLLMIVIEGNSVIISIFISSEIGAKRKVYVDNTL